MKRCSKCGEEKEDAAFWADRRRADGLQGRCKECSLAMRREWAATRPERIKRYRKKEYDALKADPAAYSSMIESNAQWRRNKKAAEPEIRREWRRRDANKLKADPDRLRRHNERKNAKERGRMDGNSHAAAMHRAKSILAKDLGVSVRDIPRDLIDAKAAHLLVHRFITKGK